MLPWIEFIFSHPRTLKAPSKASDYPDQLIIILSSCTAISHLKKSHATVQHNASRLTTGNPTRKFRLIANILYSENLLRNSSRKRALYGHYQKSFSCFLDNLFPIFDKKLGNNDFKYENMAFGWNSKRLSVPPIQKIIL